MIDAEMITSGLKVISPNVVFYTNTGIDYMLRIRCNQTPYEVKFHYDELRREYNRIYYDHEISIRDWIISRIIKPLSTGIITEDVNFEEVTYQLNQHYGTNLQTRG